MQGSSSVSARLEHCNNLDGNLERGYSRVD